MKKQRGVEVVYTYLASGIRTFHYFYEHSLDVVTRHPRSEWSERDAHLSGFAASCFGWLPSDLHVRIVRDCPNFKSAEGFFLSCRYTHTWLREKFAVAEPAWEARRILKLSGWRLDKAITRAPLRACDLLRWQALGARHIGDQEQGTDGECPCATFANQAVEIVAKCLENSHLDERNAPVLDLSETLCEHVSDAQLIAIARSCPKLDALRLVGTEVTIRGLAAILKSCSGLETLHLKHGGCSSALLEIMAKENRQLKVLHLNAWRWTDVSVGPFGAFMRGCDGIQELVLADCTWMTDAHLAHVSRHATHLTSIDLTGCGVLTASGLRTLLSRCTRLEALDLSACAWPTDEWIAVLAARGTKLKELGLAWCGCATAPHLERLLQNLAHLEALNLNSCAWLADEELEVIATLGTHLKRLDLESCGRITQRHLEAILKGIPHLESISLSPYMPLKVEAIDLIAEHGASLKRLSLKRCASLTKERLEQILRRCAKLEELILDENEKLTDTELAVIAEHGSHLKRLSLMQCSGITEKGSKAILGGCMMLESFERDVDACTGCARSQRCVLM